MYWVVVKLFDWLNEKQSSLSLADWLINQLADYFSDYVQLIKRLIEWVATWVFATSVVNEAVNWLPEDRF
jgi:hypothetical protein